MNTNDFEQMVRECHSNVLSQICEATGLDLEYMASKAAREVVANFRAPEMADKLKESLCPDA